MLTPAQKKVYDYLCRVLRRDGVCPSMREIAVACGFRSPSNIHRILDGLEERGFVYRIKDRSRAITVFETPHLPDAAGYVAEVEKMRELVRTRDAQLADLRKRLRKAS